MRNKAKLLTYSAMMCAFLMISTMWLKFTIPGSGIQVTTQVFFILLCGQILPPKYCLASIGTYLALGLAGVPVFAATQGISVIATPSFGYLVSFPVAAMVVSAIRNHQENKKGWRYGASLAGVIIIYVVAVPYIALLHALYLGSSISAAFLFKTYCLAFLPIDIIKGALAAYLGGKFIQIT